MKIPTRAHLSAPFPIYECHNAARCSDEKPPALTISPCGTNQQSLKNFSAGQFGCNCELRVFVASCQCLQLIMITATDLKLRSKIRPCSVRKTWQIWCLAASFVQIVHNGIVHLDVVRSAKSSVWMNNCLPWLTALQQDIGDRRVTDSKDKSDIMQLNGVRQVLYPQVSSSLAAFPLQNQNMPCCWKQLNVDEPLNYC